jgi:5-methyltetrahydrofolate--homocysteine methyltransferase
MSEHLQIITNAILERKKDDIQKLVSAALEAGLAPQNIIDEALILAMDKVGRDFADGTIFVPEMMVSALVMQMGLDVIKPHLAGGEMKTIGTVLLGTVEGDLHDIGKNIVAMMMAANGFKVIDLGINLPAKTIVEKVMEHNPDILGLSALLTTTMPEMKNTLAALAESGLRDRIKIIVGGAPVDESFADSIGADGYGRDASDAVKISKQLLKADPSF